MIVNINNNILNNLDFDLNMKNGRMHGNQKWYWNNGNLIFHWKCFNGNQQGISINYK